MPYRTLRYYGTNFYNQNGSVSSYSVEKGREDWSRSVTVKTPEHARRKKEPHVYLPHTAFSASIFVRTVGIGSAHRVSGNSREYPWATWSSADSMETYCASSNSDLNQIAVTRALAALKDQDVNFSQAFAERAQTSRLVASSARKVAGMYTNLRKGNFAGAAQALGFSAPKKAASRYERNFTRLKDTAKVVGDGVLELNYGWKPLLSDAHGLGTVLAKRDLQNPKRYVITVRGSARDRFESGVVTTRQSPAYQLIGKRSYGTRSTRVRLDYNQSNPNLSTLAARGFLNPLQLAWELLPWSFVADWFIPIGDYLNCMDASVGYSFLGGSRTVRNEGYGLSWEENPLNQTIFYHWYSSGHKTYAKRVERVPYSVSPFPRFPGFKNPFSPTHLVNALALLRGSVR